MTHPTHSQRATRGIVTRGALHLSLSHHPPRKATMINDLFTPETVAIMCGDCPREARKRERKIARKLAKSSGRKGGRK